MSADRSGEPPLKLELREVVKSFGTTTVLDGINLAVAEGEVITLIGASGSGKSTLLRCVNLLEPVDDGAVLFDGVDIAEPGLDADPIRRRIGMVFQSFNLFPHMTVTDNVAIGPRKVLGVPKATARANAPRHVDPARAGRARRRLPRPAVWRATATRGHRTIARNEPRGDVARRDHLGARPGTRGRGARRGPGTSSVTA